jgi:hypothetical protein
MAGLLDLAPELIYEICNQVSLLRCLQFDLQVLTHFN